LKIRDCNLGVTYAVYGYVIRSRAWALSHRGYSRWWKSLQNLNYWKNRPFRSGRKV